MRQRKVRQRRVIALHAYRKVRVAGRPDHARYTARPALLTQGELAFYRVLRRAFFGHLHVSFKTRLADILYCPEALWNTLHGRQIAQKHVDFVLLDPETTAILAVVELDDRSHDSLERRRRDGFLNRALEGAGIPLLRVRAASYYDVPQLRDQIGRLLLTRPPTLMSPCK
jgi:hypothetical protein